MNCAKEAHRMGYELRRKIGIIADGGIRHSGDIVKALAIGADAVMLGQMLAGTEESPGDTNSFQDGSRKKLYRGQSSKHFLKDVNKTNVAAEGIAVEIPYKGSVKDVLAEICGGIRSGFTYSGVPTIYELQQNAQFIEITASGWEESNTHVIGIV
jgi:IMP dehydrogenase